MEVGMRPSRPDLSDPSWQIVASEPSPSQVLMLMETVEELMRGLEEYHRPIVELPLQGYSQTEIAEQVHLTERPVRSVLRRVRERLSELVGANAEA
jgi:DNA-directed RNA polymerase specialized sigma24 family protein